MINEGISLLKGSSLVSTITVFELTSWARNGVAETFDPYYYFGVISAIYFLMVYLYQKILNSLFSLKKQNFSN